MEYHFIPEARSEARRILTAEEMRQADHFSIETLGLPGVALMESAGQQVARLAAQRLRPEDRVAVVCGRGNNGGDGFVIARCLASWDYEVEVILCAQVEELRGDAATHFQVIERMNLPVLVVRDRGSFASLPPPEHYALLLDALLGTGLSGEVRGLMAEAIAWINGHRVPVISVDIPSGLCSDSGRVLGDAVRAEETITFAASTLGHWMNPNQVGRLWIVDIGIPDSLLRVHGGERWILEPADLEPAFQRRDRLAHKGDLGHLFVLGGMPGRTGALRMCVDAALSAGVGLVTAGTTREAFKGLAPQLYEAMACPVMDFTEEPERAAQELAQAQGNYSAMVLGPGLDTRPWVRDFLFTLLPLIELPLLLDADALNHMVGHLERLKGGGPKIITPHPGEAARLLSVRPAEVQADRLGAAKRLVELSGATVVLKGAHSLILTPDGTLGICPRGNPGMASAGMGDLLSGIIGALLARRLEPTLAATAGVLWHSMAGDCAVEKRTENGLRARDLIEALADVERATCSRK